MNFVEIKFSFKIHVDIITVEHSQSGSVCGCPNNILTLNSFNENSAITKENLCTKYFPFTYKYVALNEKPPITKENLRIFFSL